MTNFIGTRIIRPVVAGLVALILLGSITPILQAGNAEAHSGTGVPYHQAGYRSCAAMGPHTFTTSPPYMGSVSGTGDWVAWSPMLYQYTAQGWVPGTRHNWAFAFAQSNGSTSRWYETASIQIDYRYWADVTPGLYAVVNFYYWFNNGTFYQELGEPCWVS